MQRGVLRNVDNGDYAVGGREYRGGCGYLYGADASAESEHGDDYSDTGGGRCETSASDDCSAAGSER